MKNVLIIGATSAIAEATARLFAADHKRLYLVARNGERLEAIAQDLLVRGAECARWETLDVNDFSRHRAMLDSAWEALGTSDIVLIAHGTLGDQKACERDLGLTLTELNTNALSVICLLHELANRMQAQGHGTIAVISSVAGDRGRRSNYVYGTAKGAVNIYLEGLRSRLFASGVHVLTIKPGFVDTPMTKNFKKGALWTTPEAIAPRIVAAIAARKNCAYLPGFWRLIMAVIKSLPESIFKRLPL